MDDGINYKSRPDCTYDYYDYPILEECANYSLNGIIHFLQNEWTKIEIKSVQWDVERAELQAKIAYLQGERKSQDNLKLDLIRRIKMLEYALKMERKKSQTISESKEETNQLVLTEPQTATHVDHSLLEFDDSDIYLELSKNNHKINEENLKWKDEKIKLKKMFVDNADCASTIESNLNKINNTEKSNDVSSISSFDAGKIDENESSTSFIDGNFKFLSNESDFIKDNSERSVKIEMPVFDPDTEEALVEFDLLVNHIKARSKNNTVAHSMRAQKSIENEWNLVDKNFISKMKEIYVQERGPGSKLFSNKVRCHSNDSDDKVIYDTVDGEDIPASNVDSDMGDLSSCSDTESEASVLSMRKPNDFPVNTKVMLPNSVNTGKVQILEDLSLGDLANLAVVNEGSVIIADPVVGQSSESNKSKSSASSNEINNSNLLKKSWTLRFTLRSHFDNIRGIIFHPSLPLLVTASEDHTLKLWNFTKTIPSKKGSVGQDVEPIYTFRGHTSPVVSLSMNDLFIFSGCVDGKIRIWKIPASPTDPYDVYDPEINLLVYFQHLDIVWSLSCIKGINRLLSASSDGTVKCWSIEPSLLSIKKDNAHVSDNQNDYLLNKIKDVQHKSLLHSYDFQNQTPSCLTSIVNYPDEAAVGFTSGMAYLFNINSGEIINKFAPPESILSNEDNTENSVHTNCIISHPAKTVTTVGYDNGFICCFDNNSGDVVLVIAAHQLSVTSIDFDQNGTFLLSGSNDGQVRVWNFSTGTCLQEITCHRPKHDESVLTVAFHPSKSLFATAGADAIAKVFI